MGFHHNFGSFHQSVKVDGKVYSFEGYKSLPRDERLAMQKEAVDRCCKANQAQSEKLSALVKPIREKIEAQRKALPKVRGRANRVEMMSLNYAERKQIDEARKLIEAVDGCDYPAAVHDVFAVWEQKVETPWEKFERLVKAHDWYYNYSDDFRFWSAGNAQAQEIRKLMDELGPDAVKLYNQECPWLNEDGTQKVEQ